MPWYHGKTLLQALEIIETRNPNRNGPLRIPIKDVYKIGGVGTVITGRIVSGTIKKAMVV